ncbi:uncharacterized protein LOC142597406 [Dermatophagoides farinae]|uniref:Uncharacterized protein n=1 Tax=Dermatophagoides farinae TaxID=6954 RepID=A0A922HUM2_DERFA|nr:hypothetical protein HUG17_7572 [Dermatophagoides farinae]KAH9511262.1 hypothetical protein DERF_009730 [Dermatophagoides farinae]
MSSTEQVPAANPAVEETKPAATAAADQPDGKCACPAKPENQKDGCCQGKTSCPSSKQPEQAAPAEAEAPKA